VTELLDVKANPRKPNYTMADEVPLVLWDCIFPAEGDPERRDVLDWVYPGGEAQSGPNGLTDNLWSTWRERKMDELLANQLLRQVSQQHAQIGPTQHIPPPLEAGKGKVKAKAITSTKIYEGGNSGRNAGKYVPVMKKDKLEPAEEQNEKYARRKGYESAEDMRVKKGFRSAVTGES
jgi:tRNA pseudouridine38/39 synthase